MKYTYQVSEQNDTRQWEFITEKYLSEYERDNRINKILQDKENYFYTSKGYEGKFFKVSYWRVI